MASPAIGNNNHCLRFSILYCCILHTNMLEFIKLCVSIKQIEDDSPTGLLVCFYVVFSAILLLLILNPMSSSNSIERVFRFTKRCIFSYLESRLVVFKGPFHQDNRMSNAYEIYLVLECSFQQNWIKKLKLECKVEANSNDSWFRNTFQIIIINKQQFYVTLSIRFLISIRRALKCINHFCSHLSETSRWVPRHNFDQKHAIRLPFCLVTQVESSYYEGRTI